MYPLEDSHQRPTVGPTGENAVSVLYREGEHVAGQLRLPEATTPSLRAQVEARLEAFFPGGVALNVTRVPNMNAVTLGIRTSPETNFLRPVHVGFGITQVLPIIVAILSSPKGTVHLIENPEVHLHPAGQALMAGQTQSRFQGSAAARIQGWRPMRSRSSPMDTSVSSFR